MVRAPRGVVPEVPGTGRESVWDYPRPPRWERVDETIEVWFAGTRVAVAATAIRVLETSHPPTYYLARDAFEADVLRPVAGRSLCEWKGSATYLDIVVGDRVAPRAAWAYPTPAPGFAVLAGHIALYPSAVDRCTIDGERVQSQPGDFYGGWITSRVVGPFKGDPGTLGW